MDSTKKKKKGRQVRLVILVVLLLLVPLAVAGVILSLNMNDNLQDGTITSVTMSFGEDTWDVEDEADVRFFSEMVQGGSEIDETATPLEAYRHLRLTFHKLNVDLSYELLLSDSVNDCVYQDAQGKLFLISPERAQELLVHPRITGLAMSYASAPVCALSAGDTDTPTETFVGEWTYTKVDGNLTTLTLDEEGEQYAVLPAEEPLQFTFSLEPDFVSVRIMDEDDVIVYSGDPAEMKPLSFQEDTPLKVTVSAEWFEGEGKSYRGKMEYTFDVKYDLASVCALAQEAVLPGEVFEIRVTHSSAPSLAVTTTFQSGDVIQYRDGKELVIRIPVGEDVTPNSYDIVLMAADVDETIHVTILDPAATA